MKHTSSFSTMNWTFSIPLIAVLAVTYHYMFILNKPTPRPRNEEEPIRFPIATGLEPVWLEEATQNQVSYIHTLVWWCVLTLRNLHTRHPVTPVITS